MYFCHVSSYERPFFLDFPASCVWLPEDKPVALVCMSCMSVSYTRLLHPWHSYRSILGGSSHLVSEVIIPVINGISRVNPLITGVITHLLSGMSHQVGSIREVAIVTGEWNRHGGWSGQAGYPRISLRHGGIEWNGDMVREYPYKIWPYMVQYLQFRILKFPLT